MHFLQYTTPGRKRGMVLSDLATAAVKRREIDVACGYIGQVVDIVALGVSSFLQEGIQKVRSQLQPFAGSQAVKILDTRIQAIA